LTEGQISGAEIQQIMEVGRTILTHPIELLPHARETVAELRQTHTVMIITKGDLFDQEAKIARSGMADLFDYIEIVSNKEPAQYRLLLMQHGIAVDRFLMVGNSLKSDILPVVASGGNAVFIPYDVTWEHEIVANAPQHGYAVLENIGQLPTYIRQIEGEASIPE
jgi:putative hydrolase of the HAD superfamily